MDPRVRKESEELGETLAHLAPSVPLVREGLLVTEDSLVLTGCQVLRVHKETVEHQDLQDQRALSETPDAQENLVYQVQGVLLVPLEFREQRASQAH